jgi:hypothetical protein
MQEQIKEILLGGSCLSFLLRNLLRLFLPCAAVAAAMTSPISLPR